MIVNVLIEILKVFYKVISDLKEVDIDFEDFEDFEIYWFLKEDIGYFFDFVV